MVFNDTDAVEGARSRGEGRSIPEPEVVKAERTKEAQKWILRLDVEKLDAGGEVFSKLVVNAKCHRNEMVRWAHAFHQSYETNSQV